ncbi:MAG TPA: two-component regulator propeller domain-containing protein, partial [Chitinophagaceae bacterium]|nr:two-component regulator propeller domain-containing protein [Chitinophagaceae bacterium]
MYPLLIHLLRNSLRKAAIIVGVPVCLLLPALLAAAPLPPLAFLDNEQGLSNNTVRSIFQDHNGFIWLGTFDGLNRYDGYDCKVYRHKLNDVHSLVHNIVLSVTEDSLHNIWIGTRQGVSRLTPLWNKFSSVYLRGNKSQLLNAVVKEVRADRSNNIFLATEGMGLLLCAQGALEAEPVPLTEAGRTITGYTVKTVRLDAAGNVWALVQKHGLARYDYAARQLVLVNTAMPDAVWMETQGSNLVIANGMTLYGYNPATPVPAVLLNYQQQLPDAGGIIAFSIDEEGRYWIGTVS